MFVLFSVVESKIRKNGGGSGTLLLMQGMQDAMDYTYKLDSKIKTLEIDSNKKMYHFSQVRLDIFRLLPAYFTFNHPIEAKSSLDSNMRIVQNFVAWREKTVVVVGAFKTKSGLVLNLQTYLNTYLS